MRSTILILGINAYHAEASAALFHNGQLVAAVEEERFARIKHIAGFPTQAVRYCLAQAGAKPEEINAVALSRNPQSHLWAKGWLALRHGFFSPAIGNRFELLHKIRNIKLPLSEALGIETKHLQARIYPVEHHRAHIASSFYPSGWESAVLLSLDGFGDLLSGMWGIGQGIQLSIHGEIAFPHSLGILYTAITQFLGFPEWGDEYKVMGLAAYGKPDPYRNALKTLVQETTMGYRLGLDYFRHPNGGVPMTWAQGAPFLGPLCASRMEKLLGSPRQPGGPIEERHADIAAALQERIEVVVFRLLQRLWERYRIPRLCYAGGVALNCVLNGKIRRETPFQEIFVQPAAHDAGTSLGAALYVHHHIHQQPRTFVMTHAAWGPETQEESCRRALETSGLAFQRLDQKNLCHTAAESLSRGKIIGWFQGRMEFGPRALGHRSLLADPRDPGMKDHINDRIKRRESFRPFAPSILLEEVQKYFPSGHPDPFMLFAYPVAEEHRKKIPSVTHIDGTSRLQAVDRESDPLYWDLIKQFDERTGIPILLNTSFNEQEPIVCTPEEALACFKRNHVDCLALGPFWAEQKSQT